VPGVEDAAGIATPPTAPPSVGRTRGARAGGDTVDLSEAARFRQRLRAEVGEIDTISSARVTQLSSQVASGTFEPPPRAIAERLLADVAGDLLA
jgi:flagellar biosynthesis anti-sigma factor FlgM